MSFVETRQSTKKFTEDLFNKNIYSFFHKEMADVCVVVPLAEQQPRCPCLSKTKWLQFGFRVNSHAPERYDGGIFPRTLHVLLLVFDSQNTNANQNPESANTRVNGRVAPPFSDETRRYSQPRKCNNTCDGQGNTRSVRLEYRGSTSGETRTFKRGTEQIATSIATKGKYVLNQILLTKPEELDKVQLALPFQTLIRAKLHYFSLRRWCKQTRMNSPVGGNSGFGSFRNNRVPNPLVLYLLP